jgi:hypothetical protein
MNLNIMIMNYFKKGSRGSKMQMKGYFEGKNK